MAKDALRKIRDGLRHAFDLASPHGPLTEEDRVLMGRIARAVERAVRRWNWRPPHGSKGV